MIRKLANTSCFQSQGFVSQCFPKTPDPHMTTPSHHHNQNHYHNPVSTSPHADVCTQVIDHLRLLANDYALQTYASVWWRRPTAEERWTDRRIRRVKKFGPDLSFYSRPMAQAGGHSIRGHVSHDGGTTHAQAHHHSLRVCCTLLYILGRRWQHDQPLARQ